MILLVSIKDNPTQLKIALRVCVPNGSLLKSTSPTLKKSAKTKRATKDALINVILKVAGFLIKYCKFLLNNSENYLNPPTLLSAEIILNLA